MSIIESTVLVTGANRGIDRAFTQELLDRGAAKVYATARDVSSINLPGVEAIQLDITDQASVDAAAAVAQDVDFVINNAGIFTPTTLLGGELDAIRLELETHLFGTLRVVRAFAPILEANGGGKLLNVLSALSWVGFEGAGAYAVAKAAEWGLTNNLRVELASQGTVVTGLHMGYVDTDMTAGIEAPKVSPLEVVRAALDGVEAERLEVLVDDLARYAKSVLGQDPTDVAREAAGAAA